MSLGVPLLGHVPDVSLKHIKQQNKVKGFLRLSFHANKCVSFFGGWVGEPNRTTLFGWPRWTNPHGLSRYQVWVPNPNTGLFQWWLKPVPNPSRFYGGRTSFKNGRWTSIPRVMSKWPLMQFSPPNPLRVRIPSLTPNSVCLMQSPNLLAWCGFPLSTPKAQVSVFLH